MLNAMRCFYCSSNSHPRLQRGCTALAFKTQGYQNLVANEVYN